MVLEVPEMMGVDDSCISQKNAPPGFLVDIVCTQSTKYNELKKITM